MNTIDQRILIPTTQNVVWDYISNLENNPDWQVDCINIAFLTTFRKGQGTRWRMGTDTGREYVVEVTAWYDRLGYEYRFIDGAPYKQNNGRLRLQEMAEGTVLQWTFNYEPGGLLGGMRNSLGLKRSIENTMQDSLWTLWKHLGEAKSQQGILETKALMQDAPDVESRAQYKPRHPSVLEDYTGKVQSTEPVFAPLIPEPPIADDDTRPRPILTDSQVQLQPVPEPDFLRDVRADSDIDAPTNRNALQSQEQGMTSNEPVVIERVTLSDPVLVDQTPSSNAPFEENLVKEPFAAPPEKRLEETASPDFSLSYIENDPNVEKFDTDKMSIFEIFGVAKPSETQESQVVASSDSDGFAMTTLPSQPTVVFTPDATTIALYGGRRGKRVLARSRLVKVRRPS
ncbi:MAG: SRPBCC family protein [Chitinophagaceae bacterium]|nr:SRPBCC family protein [Anaerolineae bacterium]